MTVPTFSIILPTYNRSEVVEQTLRQLAAIDWPDDRYEVLVADNSSDDTPEMTLRVAAEVDVPIHLVRSQHRLPAVKRNEALAAATGDYVVFLNDDLWVRPDFLREHARSHEVHDGPVAVVGQCDQSEQMPPTPFSLWYRPFAYDEIADRADQAVGPRHFWSMNLSMPRTVMLEHGLVFHEDWAEIGHEDVELGWRWHEAGFPIIFNPRAWGEHYHPHSLASACRLQESVGRGLRDLEWLVPDPTLLERYGVFSWRNSPRAVVRGLARGALFNRVTAPWLRDRLDGIERDNPAIRWAYWKIMLHHTNRGYRQAPPRQPARLVSHLRMGQAAR